MRAPEIRPKTILVVSGSEELEDAGKRYFANPYSGISSGLCAKSKLVDQLPDGTWKDVLHQTLMIHPPLLIVSYQPIGRYLWSEVLGLGGHDVLVKPFGPSDVFRQITLAWEQWKERAT